jgi:hypothetical protein
MGLNVAFNAMIGAVPIFGDIFSIWFRSNVRNAQLLERYLSSDVRPSRLGDWLFVVGLIATIVLLLIATIVAMAWLVRQAWNVV